MKRYVIGNKKEGRFFMPTSKYGDEKNSHYHIDRGDILGNRKPLSNHGRGLIWLSFVDIDLCLSASAMAQKDCSQDLYPAIGIGKSPIPSLVLLYH